MSPSFLVVGATGNTGRSVVGTLSKLLGSSSSFSDYKILAITRSAHGSTAQQLAQLPGVEVLEQSWMEIDADWLRRHKVVRAFIATPPQPSQFSDESAFYLAALHARVEYVVRISTTAANVRPDCPAYYPRTHWALEALLSTPAFQSLKWTSLQPNVFTNFYLAPAIELVQNYRKTGKQGTLRLMASEDAPVGVIDADDVGAVAARLLLETDLTKHDQARYVLNGPEDITGRQIVEMVERYIGTRLQDVRYKDMSFIDEAAAASPDRHLVLSIKHAPETAWNGQCTASTTSREVLQLAPPQNTSAKAFKAMLELGI